MGPRPVADPDESVFEETDMKKLLFLALAAAGAAYAARKQQAAQHEQALWAEATDDVQS